MNLYALQQQDLRDILALIASPSLTINAAQATRVAQLQAMLATLEPNKALELNALELGDVRRELEAAVRGAADLTAELKRMEAMRDSAYAMLREEQSFNLRAQSGAASPSHDVERMHLDDELQQAAKDGRLG